MWNADVIVVKENMLASSEDRLPDDELLGQMSYVFYDLSRVKLLNFLVFSCSLPPTRLRIRSPALSTN